MHFVFNLLKKRENRDIQIKQIKQILHKHADMGIKRIQKLQALKTESKTKKCLKFFRK